MSKFSIIDLICLFTKKDKNGRWYKVDDLNNGVYLRQFLQMIADENLNPVRETGRTKFYYIPEKYF